MYVFKYSKGGVIREVSIRTARKIHVCRICGKRIYPKEKYISVVYGDVYSGHIVKNSICLDCWRYIKTKIKNNKKEFINART